MGSSNPVKAVEATYDRVQKPMDANEVSKAARTTVGALNAPLLAPFAYLGGVEARGWRGGAEGASSVTRDPFHYFNTPQGRGQFAAGVATAGAVAGGAALTGGPVVGTGEVVGWTAGGEAIEGTALSSAGVASGLGSGGAAGLVAASPWEAERQAKKAGEKDAAKEQERAAAAERIALDQSLKEIDPLTLERRRRAAMASANGRANTILTPGTQLGSADVARKTLLGM